MSARTAYTAEHSSPGQPTDALAADLALVLGEPKRVVRTDVIASARGKPIAVDEAIAQAAALIDASTAPAIAGLGGLSIEAARQAVALAEHMRGRLLPWPAPDPIAALQPVTQTATLGHVLACDLVIWVGYGPELMRMMGRLARLIASRCAQSITLDDRLDTVLALRGQLRDAETDDPVTAAIVATGRVAVMLAPGCDARLAGQWHALAVDVQQRVRMAVLALPLPGEWANLTGAIEVITWQTGLSCATGGVDLADGAPRPCPGAQALLERNAVDLVIDTAVDPLFTNGGARRIRIGAGDDADADVCFTTPGLAIGLAARVMRFDGVVLWLCDDRARAAADPAVELLSRLRQSIREPA